MKVKIPGLGQVDIDSAVHKDAPNFTWREVTHGGTRLWKSEQMTWNAIDLAKKLQKLRDKIGRAFTVNSWYRTPEANRSAGGVPGSLHLTCKAADIVIAGFGSGKAMAKAIGDWEGGMGIYSNRVHLDTGARKRWVTDK